MPIHIRVLGTLDSDVDGVPIDLGGPRQRSVLALLLVARGEVVSVDRLIDDLWRGEPPPRAMGALQAYVSNLRRALEPDRAPRTPSRHLISAPPGYAVRFPADAVDAWQFENLLRVARDTASPTEALAVLEQALALWRGDALAEFAVEPWAAPEAARLDELRLVARERLVDAQIRAGRSAEAVVAAEALVRDVPLREEGWRLLALSQYLGGRQGDALATLRRARQLLSDELGVDPGPRLAELERDVLAQTVDVSPVVEAAPPVAAATAPADLPAPAAAPVGGFVGRARELAALHAAAAAARARHAGDRARRRGGRRREVRAARPAARRPAGRRLADQHRPLPRGRGRAARPGLGRGAPRPGRRARPRPVRPGARPAAGRRAGARGRGRRARAALPAAPRRPRLDLEPRRPAARGVPRRRPPRRCRDPDAARRPARPGAREPRAVRARLPARDERGPRRAAGESGAVLPRPGAAGRAGRGRGRVADRDRDRLGAGRRGGPCARRAHRRQPVLPQGERATAGQRGRAGRDLARARGRGRRPAPPPGPAARRVGVGAAAGFGHRPQRGRRTARPRRRGGRGRGARCARDRVDQRAAARARRRAPCASRTCSCARRCTRGVPQLRRVRWHARIAEAVAELYPSDLTALAYHSARSATPANAAEAARRCVAAAELARARFAYDAEAELYLEAQRCLELQPEPDPAALVDVLARRVRALIWAGGTTARRGGARRGGADRRPYRRHGPDRAGRHVRHDAVVARHHAQLRAEGRRLHRDHRAPARTSAVAGDAQPRAHDARPRDEHRRRPAHLPVVRRGPAPGPGDRRPRADRDGSGRDRRRVPRGHRGRAQRLRHRADARARRRQSRTCRPSRSPGTCWRATGPRSPSTWPRRTARSMWCGCSRAATSCRRECSSPTSRRLCSPISRATRTRPSSCTPRRWARS